jgi:hypothetical protein
MYPTTISQVPPPACTEQVQWKEAATSKLLAASNYFSGMSACAPPASGFGGLLYFMTFNGHIMTLQVLSKSNMTSSTATSAPSPNSTSTASAGKMSRI